MACACHERTPTTKQERRNYELALYLTLAIFVLELAFGIWGDCIALTADSAHVFIDMIAYGISIYIAYRVERSAVCDAPRIRFVGVCLSGALLFIACGHMAHEAFERLHDAHVSHLGALFIAAAIGGAGNWGQHHIVMRGSPAKNDTQRMQQWHIIVDLLQSVGLIIGLPLIYFFEWHWIDPVLTFVIVALTLFAAGRTIVLASREVVKRSRSDMAETRACADVPEHQGCACDHEH